MLAKNSVWGIASSLVPAAAMLVSLPIITGLENSNTLALLGILWAGFSYLAVCDFGIGKLLTIETAPSPYSTRSGRIIILAVLFGLAIGCILSGVLAAVIAWTDDLAISQIIRESPWGFALLILSTALGVQQNVFRGALEARNQFGLSGAIRGLNAASLFLAPAAAIIWGNSSASTILVWTSAARIVVALGAMYFTVQPLRIHQYHLTGAIPLAGEMARGASWLGAIALLGPLMVYMDRFLLMPLISSRDLATYSVLQEFLLKSLVIPNSIAAAALPLFSKLARNDGGMGNRHLLRKTSLTTAGLFTTFAIALITLSSITLAFLFPRGPLPEQAQLILILLVLGLIPNAVAHISAASVIAHGASRDLFRIYVIEAGVYFALLWYAATTYGAAGAAFAWSTRAMLDAVLVSRLANRKSHSQVFL